jgi:hypothetical protein
LGYRVEKTTGLVLDREHNAAINIENRNRNNTAGTAGIQIYLSNLSIDTMKHEATYL